MADSGDHDVVLLRYGPRVQGRGFLSEVGEYGVRPPRRDRDHALAIVGHDVEAKAEARAPRDLANRFVEWIPLDLGETDSGILEEAHAVRRCDHGLAGAPDGDGLPTT